VRRQRALSAIARGRRQATDPDVIVTHSCGALWDGTLIVMDAEQTLDLCEAAPHATVIATHMEALDHATVSRAALRRRPRRAGSAASAC
jgi:hypothetical protein